MKIQKNLTPATPKVGANDAVPQNVKAGKKTAPSTDNFITADGQTPVAVNTTEPRTLRSNVVVTDPAQLLSLYNVTGIAGDLVIECDVTDAQLKQLEALQWVSGKVEIKGGSSLQKSLVDSLRAKAYHTPFDPITSVDPQPTPPIAPKKLDPKQIQPAEWNFYVHLNADNNLDNFGWKDVNEMETVGSIPGKMNVFALVDTWGKSSNPDWSPAPRLMLIQKDPENSDKFVSSEIEIDPASELGKAVAAGNGDINMGDPTTLRAALTYLQENCPSKHTLVDFWNHGAGYPGLSYDDKPRDGLSLPGGELRKALEGLDIDVLSADSCLMANKEMYDEAARLGIKQLAASEENEPGDGWNYATLFKAVEERFAAGKQMQSDDLAKIIADTYTAKKGNKTFSVTHTEGALRRGSSYQMFHQQFEQLSDVLTRAGGLNNNKAIKKCYTDALRFGGGSANMMDIGDFCLKLTQTFPDGELKTAAQGMMDVLAKVSYAKTDDPNPKTNKYTRAQGLSVYAPLGRPNADYSNPEAAWKDSKWVSVIGTAAQPVDPNFQPPAWAVALPPPAPTPAPAPAPKV